MEHVTSQAAQSEKTRERIVDAAARLFARKGFSATSIADLANAVGMTKGALYHHFESKDAIFFAVLSTIRSTWRNVVAREVVGTHDALARLGVLLDNQARFLQANESFCLVLNGLMTEMEGVNPRFLAEIQEVYGELARFIEQIVRKGQSEGQVRADIDPKVTAMAIVGTMRGTGCSRPVSERMAVDYSVMMETLKKVLVNGLRP